MSWDERYDTIEYIYGTKPNDFLAENTDQLPEGKILCLADGEGRNSVYLAKLGYQVTAVDLSEKALQKAGKLAEAENVQVEFIQADLSTFTIKENDWDGIVSIFCHVPEDIRKNLHKNVVGGLKSGGRLLLEAYRPDQLKYKTGGPPVESMMMTISKLKHELDGLDLLTAEEVDREIVEGTFHTGLGAVTRVIAEKR